MSRKSIPAPVDLFERTVRNIVQGQIRSFVKDHPSITLGVDWYKPRDDKVTTLVNSLTKRIAGDLTCEATRVRLRQALVEHDKPDNSPVTAPTANASENGDMEL